MKIFNFDEYQSWLKWVIDTKISKNSQFSTSHFARRLGISQSLFSLILSHKRSLSIKNVFKIVDYLKLSSHETKYFLLLIEKNKTKSLKQLNMLQKELDELKKRAFTAEKSAQSKRPFSAWHYNLLLASTALHSIPRNSEGIAGYLGFNTEDVIIALDLMVHLGLVQKKEDEYYFVENGISHLPKNIQKHSKWKISKKILENAQLRFESNNLEIDFIDGQITATNLTQIKIAQKKIEDFMNEIREILLQGEKNTLVQYSFQIFEAE